MITQVDHHNNYEVQKVTKPNGALLRYQVVQLPAGDSTKVEVFATLESARAKIGKTNGGKAVH